MENKKIFETEEIDYRSSIIEIVRSGLGKGSRKGCCHRTREA